MRRSHFIGWVSTGLLTLVGCAKGGGGGQDARSSWGSEDSLAFQTSLPSTRMVQITWASAPQGARIQRTELGADGAPLAAAAPLLAQLPSPDGTLDDPDTRPRGHYRYEVIGPSGRTLGTAVVHVPDIRVDAAGVTLAWPGTHPDGTVAVFDLQSQKLQEQPISGSMRLEGLHSDKFHFLQFRLASGVTSRIGFTTLPELPQIYLDTEHTVPGGRVAACVNNPLPSRPLRLRLERLHPDPAVLVEQVLSCQVTDAPYDGARQGFDWPAAATWGLPADAPSGLYRASVGWDGLPETWRRGFPLVVGPAAGSRNKLLVLANSYTWQAYNHFGGASFYENNMAYPFPEKAPLYGKPAPRPEVSFRRPNVLADPAAPLPGDFRATAECMLLAWLDAHGVGYDLVSDQDLEALDPAAMAAQYEALVLNVHPEYWSLAEEDVIRGYLAAGGNLVSLAGNTAFSRVARIQGPERLVRTAKPRDMGEVRSLLGTGYDLRFIPQYGPYAMSQPRHWVFEGIPEGPFGTGGPAGGASGWETDRTGVGTPFGTLILAAGADPELPVAHMVIFQTPKGGTVFNASSVSFTSTLASDPKVSRLLANVLRRLAPGAAASLTP